LSTDALTEVDRVVCGKLACFTGFPLSQDVQVDDTCTNPTAVIGAETLIR